MTPTSDLEATLDGTAPPPPPIIDPEGETVEDTPAKKAKKDGKDDAKKERPVERDRPIMRPVDREDEQNFRDYFRNLAGSMPFQIKVERRRPEQVKVNGKIINCAGILGTHEEMIDEDFIRDTYGGGTYLIRMLAQKAGSTQFQHAGSRQIKIPGEPKVDGVFMNDDAQAVGAAPAPDPAAGKMMDRLMSQNDRLIADRLAAAEKRGGVDPDILALLKAPLERENADLKELLREMRTELKELRDGKNKEQPGDVFRDKMLDKFLDGDSKQLQTLRDNHASEIRQMQQAMKDLEARLRDQFEREKDRIEKGHEREIASLTRANDIAMGAINSSGTVQVKMLEGEVKRLEKDVDFLRSENAKLRDKKEVGPLEALELAEKVKELVGGDKEDEEKGKIQQFAEATGIKDVVQAVGARIMQAGVEAMPQQQAQQQIAVGQRFQDAQGAWYVMTPGGAVPIRPGLKQGGRRGGGQPRPQQPGAPAPAGGAPPNGAPGATGAPAGAAAGGAPAPGAPISFDPADVMGPIRLLENAYHKQMDPAVVAQTARTMAPPALLQAIKDGGVDVIIDQVAGLDGNSPLVTQAGRNYLRKVAKALAGD